MALDLTDHEARLRQLELRTAEDHWLVAAHERLLPTLVERQEELRQWRRDVARNDVARQAGLTRREKYIGMVLLVATPLLSVAVQHLLK